VENLELYNKLREVPKEAKKEIGAGRLKGFTDINPMWRIKRMTEVFGPCGIGWWYVIKDKHMEGDEKEVRAFVDVDLFYKLGDEVSQPVPGTGGASFVTQERNGAYISDECYKMALTDALSVAMKSIGVGADVYYEKDRDKYTTTDGDAPKKQEKKQTKSDDDSLFYQTAEGMIQKEGGVEYGTCAKCGNPIYQTRKKDGTFLSVRDMIVLGLRSFNKPLCKDCYNEAVKSAKEK